MTFALDPTDTIAAVSTAPGPAARGIVRITGPRAHEVARSGFRADDPTPPSPINAAQVFAGRYRLPGLALEMPARVAFWYAPRTYTGQDLAEIHTCGSRPLLDRLLQHVLDAGSRLARPGEFTLRAYLVGRIDLTAAEAVLGVIDARTPDQLDASLRQLAGGLAGPLSAFRNRLLDLLAHLEAGLDFVDEDDVDPIERATLVAELDAGLTAVRDLAARLGSRHRSSDAPRVVLFGRANAGKSSLFNALVGEELAIVSEHEGTTRDYLEASLRCGPLEVRLVDTAGTSAPAGLLDAEGHDLRRREALRSDLLLICSPADDPVASRHEVPTDRPCLHVATRCDLAPAPPGHLPTSVRTGLGLEDLKSALASAVGRLAADADPLAHSAARCRESLGAADRALTEASGLVRAGGYDELLAVELRQALDALGEVVGETVTDDILGRIFSRFCIGK